MDENRRRKVTIYDVAKEAGASATSVSFVLNGSWRQHRIKADTATRVLECAERLGYAVNLKARGLRLSRSGLAGMILPHYRNRFFAGLAEAFEAKARTRGLCPIVVSTHRNPENEVNVAETLLAQQVEFLFIAGVNDPDPLNALCHAANVRCVNIDLPGTGAPSVVSDNFSGASLLTEVIISKVRARGGDPSDLFFFGGDADDDATRNRLLGFNAALAREHIALLDGSVDCCGYPPTSAAQSLAKRYRQLGRMPAGLFVNGVTALEGALRFISSVGDAKLASVVVGSFDWDPFAAHLPFDVTMVRQNVEVMIAEAFRLIDTYTPGEHPLVVIPTSFGQMGEQDGAQEDWSGNSVKNDPC